MGARTVPGSRTRPQASAISTTAVVPRRAYDDSTGTPVGAGDRDGHAFESAGDRRIERAVAAIGDRQAVDHGSGNLTACAAGQRVGDLGG